MVTISKAIIPVAGWGTRMLPITKSIEKSMLPVGTRPVVDYIVQDILAAGITEIYFVVGEQSSQIQSYYRSNIQLNDYLKRTGKEDKLALVAPPSGVKTHFIVQPSTGGYGTSVPVGLTSPLRTPRTSGVDSVRRQYFQTASPATLTLGNSLWNRPQQQPRPPWPARCNALV